MIYVLGFFVFAFIGWIIDTTYSSFSRKKITISGYFKGAPFCPIYGFGGILLFNNFALMSQQPPWLNIFTTTLYIIILEYVGGWFSEHFLDEKLWDYSDEKFNLNGYISAWHSYLWLILVTFAYLIFGHQTTYIFEWLSQQIKLDQRLEVTILFAIFIVALWLTAKNKKLRLAKLAQTSLNGFLK